MFIDLLFVCMVYIISNRVSRAEKEYYVQKKSITCDKRVSRVTLSPTGVLTAELQNKMGEVSYAGFVREHNWDALRAHFTLQHTGPYFPSEQIPNVQVRGWGIVKLSSFRFGALSGLSFLIYLLPPQKTQLNLGMGLIIIE